MAATTEAPADEEPPVIAPWLLHLRAGLEVGSLIALGAGARRVVGSGIGGWIAAVVVPLAIAIMWGVFAVPGDPSRNRKAVVPVPGWLRIAFEMTVFFAAAVALASLNWWDWFDAFIAGFVVHHAGTRARILWILRQS